MIFNIQRYSTHDGEGIRTLVFYKGCPLRCQWCSNPESQSFEANILYDSRSCKHFGDCALRAPEAISQKSGDGLQIQRKLITDPDRLRDICASKALTVSGEKLSVDELLAEVRKDLPFYRENGGVTLSGGEPLAQDFSLIEFLQRLHEENISCNMETSLHVKWELVERTIGLVKIYLADLKHMDPVKFREYTHGDAYLVLENLRKLAYFGAHVVVRIPVIPGFNHSQKEIQDMINEVSLIKGIREIHFLPYHTFGLEKYRMLGMDYNFTHTVPVPETELLPYVEYAESKGFITKIGG